MQIALLDEQLGYIQNRLNTKPNDLFDNISNNKYINELSDYIKKAQSILAEQKKKSESLIDNELKRVREVLRTSTSNEYLSLAVIENKDKCTSSLFIKESWVDSLLVNKIFDGNKDQLQVISDYPNNVRIEVDFKNNIISYDTFNQNFDFLIKINHILMISLTVNDDNGIKNKIKRFMYDNSVLKKLLNKEDVEYIELTDSLAKRFEISRQCDVKLAETKADEKLYNQLCSDYNYFMLNICENVAMNIEAAYGRRFSVQSN